MDYTFIRITCFYRTSSEPAVLISSQKCFSLWQFEHNNSHFSTSDTILFQLYRIRFEVDSTKDFSFGFLWWKSNIAVFSPSYSTPHMEHFPPLNSMSFSFLFLPYIVLYDCRCSLFLWHHSILYCVGVSYFLLLYSYELLKVYNKFKI